MKSSWVVICVSEEMGSDILEPVSDVTSDADFWFGKHFHVTTQFALYMNWLTAVAQYQCCLSLNTLLEEDCNVPVHNGMK